MTSTAPSNVTPLCTGPIPISATLGHFLAAAAASPNRDAFAPKRTIVSLVWLLEVEQTRGATLPWDVITLSILGIPAIKKHVGFSLDALMSPQETCAVESLLLPRGWIPIASFAWVPDDTSSIDTMLGIASQRDDRAGDPELTIVDRFGETHATTLSKLLWERLAKALDAKPDGDDTVPPEYVVTVVDDRPVPTTRTPVVHPKFGRGTIIEDLGDGKVRVELETGDVRVLLRRFLADA